MVRWKGLLILVLGSTLVEGCPSSSSAQTLRIAVLPFVTATGAAERSWLSRALAGSLWSDLSAVRSLKVLPRGTVYRYLAKLPPRSPSEMIPAVVSKFRCDLIVTGSFDGANDHLTITATIVALASPPITVTVSGPLSELLDLQDRLSLRVIESLGVPLAEREKEKVLEKPTNSLEAYILFCQAAEAWDGEEKPIGDVDQAIRLLERALEIDPRFYKAAVNLGIALERKDLLAPAERAYRQAIAHQPPDFPLAHYALAGLYEKAGLLDKALSEADRALKADSSFVPGWVRKGYLAYLQGRFAQALSDFQQALQLDPEYALAWNNIGLVHLREGRTAEAERSFRKVLELDNDDEASAYAHNNLGNLFRRRGDFTAAMAQYLLAIGKKDDFAIAWANLGDMHLRFGDRVQAMQCYERALKLDPSLSPVRRKLQEVQRSQ
ncbi:MAG: tetratricopeptide repeat protein [Armatimonadetes bacterium]|nr:tetratricopeptide repeat protein [Armatimonadota bacterium]MDW8120915.1 tetratricopeptide repeat protein [Armatimonadota bacterium]